MAPGKEDDPIPDDAPGFGDLEGEISDDNASLSIVPDGPD